MVPSPVVSTTDILSCPYVAPLKYRKQLAKKNVLSVPMTMFLKFFKLRFFLTVIPGFQYDMNPYN